MTFREDPCRPNLVFLYSFFLKLLSEPCGIDVASLYINTIISFRCCSIFISSFKQNTKKSNTANFIKRRKKNTIFPMSSLSRKKSKQIIDTIYLYIKNKYLFIVRRVYLHHLEMIIVQLLWMFFIWIDLLTPCFICCNEVFIDWLLAKTDEACYP